jgi:hypothetical protein
LTELEKESCCVQKREFLTKKIRNPVQERQEPGWPDEFVKDSPQNVAQAVFCQNQYKTILANNLRYSCVFKK